MSAKKQYNPIWEKQQEEWWYNFWSKFNSPWRPSKREMKFFETVVRKLIKDRGKIKVLVMGATPEFRDMLFKYRNKAEVVLLDLNPPVKKAMDRLRKKINPLEKLVEGDWLKMDRIFPKDYFDVIMNDEGFENIGVKKHPTLFKSIMTVLKSDGYLLIGRLCMEYCFKHPLKINQVIGFYLKDRKKFVDFYNHVLTFYRLAAGEKGVYDHKKQGVQMHVLTDKLMRAAQKVGIKNLKDFQWTPELEPSLKYTEIDVAQLKTIESTIDKYFKIEKIYQDLFHPIMRLKYNFVLRPKK